MVTRVLRPSGVWALVACLAVSHVAAPLSWALPSESASVNQTADVRAVYTERILSALTSPAAQYHLRQAGLNPRELRAQLARLDTTELASLSERTDAIRAGGDALVVIGISLGTIVLVAIVALIVYLVIKEHEEGHLP